jgi:hypothetical protein
MSVQEGEPLPGTQNVDGSEKPQFALTDARHREGKSEAELWAENADQSEKSSEGKSKS